MQNKSENSRTTSCRFDITFGHELLMLILVAALVGAGFYGYAGAAIGFCLGLAIVLLKLFKYPDQSIKEKSE